MKIMVITGSPNKEGLTADCGNQARLGAEASGAEVTSVCLNDLNIGRCRACNNGWGTCRDRHVCQVEDDFQKLHAGLKEIDGFILVTPVYWWDMSESVKAFVDRLRRCEALKGEDQFIGGKPVISVAAAGGTGNGCISCLTALEKFVDHVKGIKFDFIGVTRRNKDYKLKTIFDAGGTMAESLGNQ
ncbi:MAG: iron-sulfur protein [Peptococcaceae bacterium BICA1-7]|nr:MAG: iron-sulfur protein [Peptococcaceae bacterium BICA1-7]HBV98591.1 flavodoxin family protein [Desulfotomaculum sp.]